MSDNLTQALKNHHLSTTTARQTVFEALYSAKEPLSMSQLVARCAGINRASVYRTISLFEKYGFIRRLQQGWKYQIELSDIFLAHHHHLTCSSCGVLIELTNEAELSQLITTLSQPFGFHPLSHVLEITGLCRSCQQK